MSIFIGFEVPTGRRVEIPEDGHVAIFGQTQLSGKTTFIEAMISRAPKNVKAVAFITKRGEGSFLTARTIPPYFAEPVNDPEQPLWRWVSAILEASQKRTLRFEESWLISACEKPKHAESLADVHQNIQLLLGGEGEYIKKGRKSVHHWIHKPVTGINAGVYTSLNAYFSIVMPQLARMPYTKSLSLKPGLNVMDLREYSIEAQGMVIRSVMEWVYKHERNTRVVVPEAQDFVPQGRNSPVKMACESLVRKGAADKNFMWLDSQDMAAVDKVMLRAVSILGCGVQGEAHEMNRSIAHLFGANTKLTPRDIGSLKVGQFYIRVAGGDVQKVYVQPVFMDSEVHARAIATGQESVASARQILRKFKEERASDAETVAEDNQRVDAGVQQDAGAPLRTGEPTELPGIRDGEENPRSEAADAGDARRSSIIAESGAGGVAGDASLSKENPSEVQNKRWPHGYDPRNSDDGSETPLSKGEVATADEIAIEAEYYSDSVSEVEAMPKETVADRARYAIINEPMPAGIRTLFRDLLVAYETFQSSPADVTGPEARSTERTGGNGAAAATKMAPAAPDWSVPNSIYWDGLYRYVRDNLAANAPGILQLLASRPELRVTVQRTVIELDDSTLAGKCARLISKGFFKSPMGVAATQKELRRIGSEQPTTNVRRALDKLNEQGFLTAEADGFQSVEGMKVNILEQK